MTIRANQLALGYLCHHLFATMTIGDHSSDVVYLVIANVIKIHTLLRINSITISTRRCRLEHSNFNAKRSLGRPRSISIDLAISPRGIPTAVWMAFFPTREPLLRQFPLARGLGARNLGCDPWLKSISADETMAHLRIPLTMPKATAVTTKATIAPMITWATMVRNIDQGMGTPMIGDSRLGRSIGRSYMR